MKTREEVRGLGFRLVRGLSSFEARAIALIVLLLLVFPDMSRAEPGNNVSVEIFSGNRTIRGGTLKITAVVNGTGNVTLNWLLPAGFEPMNGTESTCTMPCNRTIIVRVNGSIDPGTYEVGVEVSA